MTRGALSALGTRAASTLVIAAQPVRDEQALLAAVEFCESAHPLPDERSVAAARRATAFARAAAERGEPLLVLLSGGASAMLAAPADGISLDDKRRTTLALMRGGAAIHELNCVRKHLSAIKGGRLALAARECVTLAISDVHLPQDDPSSIGSGPTVADPSTFADALTVVRRYSGAIPDVVLRLLEQGAAGAIGETPKPGDPRLALSTFQVIANRHTAMDGAAAEARRLGYAVSVLPVATGGEARGAGRSFADLALGSADNLRATCVIASGETTVTVRGDGRGGRNQEFALGAAPVLAAYGRPAVLASAGTDGVDGPTDAAGALVTSTTMTRAKAIDVDIKAALDHNDAYPALARLDDLIQWGPTGTNVGDVHIVLTMGS